jgi:hypothetical protein
VPRHAHVAAGLLAGDRRLQLAFVAQPRFEVRGRRKGALEQLFEALVDVADGAEVDALGQIAAGRGGEGRRHGLWSPRRRTGPRR